MAFDAKANAAILNKAMKGLGTDEKALNSVMGKWSKAELLQIAEEYKTLYKVTLEKDIKGDTSGNYERLLVWLQKPVVQVKIDYIKLATKGAGTREKYLIDILAPASNAEIQEIYQTDPSAIAAIHNDVSVGDFAKVISALLKHKREESHDVNEEEAARVAEQLYKAGEGKIGTDEDTFTEIFTTRSPAFLKRASYHYAANHKRSLEQAIKKETSGDYEDVLVALLKTKYEYFADRFWDATHGAGTDDTFLCFALSTLSRDELHKIAVIFQEKRKTTLLKKVSDDVSGDYGNLIKLLLQ